MDCRCLYCGGLTTHLIQKDVCFIYQAISFSNKQSKKHCITVTVFRNTGERGFYPFYKGRGLKPLAA